MVRRYFAVLRTRYLLHTFSPDLITRGVFKFYSYNRKRDLYIRGVKDMNMKVVKPNFLGSFRDTSYLFFNPDVYEEKKDRAITDLITQDETNKEVQIKPTVNVEKYLKQRAILAFFAYDFFNNSAKDKVAVNKFSEVLKQICPQLDLTHTMIKKLVEAGQKMILEQNKGAESIEEIDEVIRDLFNEDINQVKMDIIEKRIEEKRMEFEKKKEEKEAKAKKWKWRRFYVCSICGNDDLMYYAEPTEPDPAKLIAKCNHCLNYLNYQNKKISLKGEMV